MLVLLGMAMTSASAQNEQEKINEIKKNLGFIYATGTSMNSAEEASQMAKDLLADAIGQWLKDVVEGDFSGYVAKAKINVSEIATQRGQLMRSFVYVRKTDILPLDKDESVMMVTKEVPVKVDTVVVRSANTTAQHKEHIAQQTLPVFTPTTAEREILAVGTFREINQYLVRGSESGRVSAYGKYESGTRLMGKSYLFLFNNEGTVLAVLRKSGDSMINLSTGLTSAISDYGRCGVIWFQINED